MIKENVSLSYAKIYEVRKSNFDFYYAWFPKVVRKKKMLRLCLVPGKFKAKYEREKIKKKDERKIKNKFKVKKLFLYIF